MIDALLDYVGGGARLSAGFWPVTSAEMDSWTYVDNKGKPMPNFALEAPGQGMRYEQFGPHVMKTSLGGGVTERFQMPEHMARVNSKHFGPFGGWGTVAASGLGSAYFIYSGYQEGGLSGAITAGYTDVAIMAATNSALYTSASGGGAIQRQLTGGLISGPLNFMSQSRTVPFTKMKVGGPGWGSAARFAKQARVMLGAGLGATAGATMGLPGTFLGAFVGGHAARVPHIAGAALLAGGAAALTGRIGLSYLKAGYEKGRNRRRIDTAGSTASFMTQNAFTSRQRAVSAMQNSHLNARSAMGMEATYMHMNRDYFSQYRRV